MTDLEELRKQTERGDRLDQMQGDGPENEDEAENGVDTTTNGSVDSPAKTTASAPTESIGSEVDGSSAIDADESEPAVDAEPELGDDIEKSPLDQAETAVQGEVESVAETGEATEAVEAESASEPDSPPEPDSASTEETPEESSNELQVVEFLLGNDVCALEIAEVESLVEMTNVTRVPRTSDAIDGVIDLRGETTAIIDLKSFLGTTGDDDGEYIIVLDRPDDKQKVGITVDEVSEVVTHDRSYVDDSTALADLNTRGMQHSVSQGVIRKMADDELELVVWLDIDAVIEGIQEGDGVVLDTLGEEQVAEDGAA